MESHDTGRFARALKDSQLIRQLPDESHAIYGDSDTSIAKSSAVEAKPAAQSLCTADSTSRSQAYE